MQEAGGWVWGNRHERYGVIGGGRLEVDVRQNEKPGGTFDPGVHSRRGRREGSSR